MKLPHRLTSPVVPRLPPSVPGNPPGRAAPSAPAPGSNRLRAVPAPRDLAEELKEHSERFRKVKEVEQRLPDPRAGDAVPVDLSRELCSTLRSAIPAMLAESMSLAEEPAPASEGQGAPAPAPAPHRNPSPSPGRLR
jgi:hypothetical protein